MYTSTSLKTYNCRDSYSTVIGMGYSQAYCLRQSLQQDGHLMQGSKFKFEFGSTCAIRCKFLGALPKF